MKCLLLRNDSERPIEIIIEPWLASCAVHPGESVKVSCETSSDELEVSMDGEGNLTFETVGDFSVLQNDAELISLRILKARMPDANFDRLISSIPKIRPLFR
jgi:hypothetical protein